MFVCPRCRHETKSARLYRKHLFERKTPCVPHADGYMKENHQPVFLLKKYAHRLRYPEKVKPEHLEWTRKFFSAINVNHWSLKMIPEDERENFKDILKEIKSA